MTRKGARSWGSGLALAAVLAAGIAVGCGSGTSLTCGPGTVQRGESCVVGGTDGGLADDRGADSSAGDAHGDARSDAAVSDAFPGWAAPNCTGDAAVTAGDGGTLIPVTGTLREIVIDPCNEHAYATNISSNAVEDYAVAARALKAPISVGSKPVGLDVTPDNRQLYVANSGGTNVSIVDLASRQEKTKVNFTSGFSGDTALSVAITSNGKALFSTTFGGSGFGGRLLSFDVTSQLVAVRTDFFASGMTTEATLLKASADHTVVGAVAGDISSAPVFVYHAATDAFSPEHDLNGFVSRVAVNPHGTSLAVNGTYLLDDGLNLLGTVSGGTGGPFSAYGPTGTVLYRSMAGGIQLVDATHFLVTGSISVTADTMSNFTTSPVGGSSVGNLAVSSDGKWLALITDHGITIIKLP